VRHAVSNQMLNARNPDASASASQLYNFQSACPDKFPTLGFANAENLKRVSGGAECYLLAERFLCCVLLILHLCLR
jgi:hypothetical protein